jgi:FKBP-type peptidyl-prolyl cis-trans isomerase FklB
MRVSTIALAFALAFVRAAPSLADDAKPAPPPAPPQAAPAPAGALVDPKAQTSYAIGFSFGAQLRGEGIDAMPDAVAKGFADGLINAPPQVPQDQMNSLLAKAQADAEARHQAAVAHLAETNRLYGLVFLKENAAKPGVVTLPSGLEYQVVKAGTGRKPKLDDVVVCNYRGALTDGTPFDSSYDRGTPSTFPVSDVIPGWTQALQLMPVGSTWRIFVPSSLGYGDKGAPPKIGPNAVLVFDIELLSILPKG